MEILSMASSSSSQETYSEEERSLFLGDLSCFVQEQDIFNFFHAVGEIDSIRLMRSKTTNKCLGYGFITFVDINVLPLAMQLYGKVLLGRRVKIGLANPRKTSPVSAKIAALMKEIDRARLNTKDSSSTTAQVHFSYLTQQTRVIITEETIRNIFSQFGEVDDVTIKKSCIDAHSQHGYGFVHFFLNDSGIDAAIKATSVVRQIVIDGVLYDSCLTRSLEAVLHTPHTSSRPQNARRNSPPQFQPQTYDQGFRPHNGNRFSNFGPAPGPTPVVQEREQFSTYFQGPASASVPRDNHRGNRGFHQTGPLPTPPMASFSEDFSFSQGREINNSYGLFTNSSSQMNSYFPQEPSFDGIHTQWNFSSKANFEESTFY